jgi:diguanylate cyclase (GGDEF)-like protein
MRSYGGTRPGSGAPWWMIFILCGALATTLYAANIAPFVAYTVIGGGSIASLVIGPRWHRVQPRRPWTFMTIAAILFLGGALVRPIVSGQPGLVSLLADVCTVPGYLLLIIGLGSLLYARQAIERHSFIDGLIVCVGATLASALLLAVPAASIHGRPVIVSALAALYPLLDAVLVLIATNLAFTTAVRQPSFVMMVLVITLILGGDLAYAIIGISGELYGSRLLDLPFLLAFTMIGAMALHPSMDGLGRATPLPVQAWSWQRLLVIGPALCVPFLLTATISGTSWLYRVALAVGGALIVGLLLVRAVSAVQGYAVAQRRYAHQATHDFLTGLPNRRMLADVVNRLPGAAGLDREARIWMFFLDLDGFKFVNDSWGHPAGDQLIVDVGNRLRAAMPTSTTVARVGGDEFVIVALCDQNRAMDLAELAMSCLQSPLEVGGSEVVITGSMGIASADPNDAAAVSAESLMREADTAMYRTKAEGRGSWTVFDPSMHEQVRERIEIELALRTAVGQNQLFLAYQPIVDLDSGRPLGAEALVRWEHPVRGPIPPAVFIPIAEHTSLITAIGTWVLRRSIRQLSSWRAQGEVRDDFWLSINVSPRQLTDANFPNLVAEELMQHDVPAACVVLEITETVMVEASDVTEQVLFDLRTLGVRISVDDFGTGFSALGYLRRHPVTGVKIDRSFVSGLGASAEDEEIVRAVVAMSTALGLSVVAEGVETIAQRDVLANLGVTLGQGWLWGRPVDPDWFAQHWAADIAAPPAGSDAPTAQADTRPAGAAQGADAQGADVQPAGAASSDTANVGSQVLSRS